MCSSCIKPETGDDHGRWWAVACYGGLAVREQNVSPVGAGTATCLGL